MGQAWEQPVLVPLPALPGQRLARQLVRGWPSAPPIGHETFAFSISMVEAYQVLLTFGFPLDGNTWATDQSIFVGGRP